MFWDHNHNPNPTTNVGRRYQTRVGVQSLLHQPPWLGKGTTVEMIYIVLTLKKGLQVCDGNDPEREEKEKSVLTSERGLACLATTALTASGAASLGNERTHQSGGTAWTKRPLVHLRSTD